VAVTQVLVEKGVQVAAQHGDGVLPVDAADRRADLVGRQAEDGATCGSSTAKS